MHVPFAAQAEQVIALGSTSGRDNPQKVADCGLAFFHQDGHTTPLIKDCAAFLAYFLA
mgnify:CR=1 FL=1